MLALSNQLQDVPIMSLQTGAELARTIGAIIDPRTLLVAAFYVDGPQITDKPSVLHISDIRESADMGYIVDSSEVIMPFDDLVRLKEIVDMEFEPIGTLVYDDLDQKLGKVSDFAFDPSSFYIQQLYVHQSLLRNLTTTSNVISRDQIVAVMKDRIIVKSPTIKEGSRDSGRGTPEFVNPFRSPSRPEPNQSTRH